ncbi:unnamed protein product [Ilex paraguariensis]|uniref:THH1/TOM1/TOM3 domain-containing protein n=1 Tax=Ilex paraguariensis TaxID=185542 RepID=A0ABC8UAP8_9AQUA
MTIELRSWEPRRSEMTRMPLSFPSIDIGGLSSNWWDEINESVKWQDGIFYALCAAFALVSSVALVLLLILLDLPGLLFFSTFTLLVLFWAEIYHQASKRLIANARSLPTDKLRVWYISVNGAVYFIQACIWVYLWIDDNSTVEFIGKIFIAAFVLTSIFYCSGIAYSSIRVPAIWRKVGSVTAICFACFLIRCFMVRFRLSTAHYFWKDMFSLLMLKVKFKDLIGQMSMSFSACMMNSSLHMQVVLSAFDSDASLDVLNHPVLNLIYYMVTAPVVEILPSALVLYILRKLPPKRISAQYHPIR